MKLRTKIFLGSLIGIFALISVLGVSVHNVQRDELLASLESNLLLTSKSITQIETNYRSNKIAAVETVADDWGLRKSVARGDAPTAISVLKNHRDRVDAKAAMFMGLGNRIITTNEFAPEQFKALHQQLRSSQNVPPFLTLELNNKYYSVITTEVKAPAPIGWLAMVFSMSELMQVVDLVAAHDASQILLIDTQANNEHPLASANMPQAAQDHFRSALAPNFTSGRHNVVYQNEAFYTHLSYLDQDERLALVVIQSVNTQLETLTEFQRQIVILLLLFGVGGLLYAFAIAAHTTKPLGILVRSAQRLEAGDFSSEVAIHQSDEIGELATAFRSMQSAIAEREQQVTKTLHELKHQASHDALTGLANRITLNEQLQLANTAAKDEGQTYNLCILDLDRFKIVNDSSGHAAGDALLKKIARLLSEAVYPTDTVARLGGDEFALIIRNCEADIALRICNDIRQQIEDLAFVWEGKVHKVGVSIGVLSTCEPVENVSEIMQRADAGCFVAKDNGRNQVYQVTNIDSVERKRDELHWVQRLHAAIDNNELILYVQPLVALQEVALQDVTSRQKTSEKAAGDPADNIEQVESFEVLVRLRNYQTGKLVPPAAFVPSAERYGVNAKIDRWVVSQLLKSAKVYESLFGDSRVYWINLSAASFGDQLFMQFLEEAVSEYGFAPGRLNFEITETSVIRDLDETRVAMDRLRKLGCQFALDDFGTGLTSFEYLKALPIDYVKLDGRFIKNLLTDPIDRIFVKSIIEIGKEMGMKTVAEFVESEEVFNTLREMGADFAQGYFVGEPRHLLPEVASQSPALADTHQVDSPKPT